MSIFRGLARFLPRPVGAQGLTAQVPDGTTAGGLGRGANAVDWQTLRGSASRVASGVNSVVGGGDSNAATNTAATVAGGSNNFATGVFSWAPGGANGDVRALHGKGAWASGRFSANGDAQASEAVLRRSTTDATPAALTSDGAAPGALNQPVLPNNAVFGGRIVVVARESGGAGKGMFAFDFLARRDANAASTLVSVAAATPILAGVTTGWAVAVSQDTVNGALTVTATGAGGQTIRWVARIMSAEVVG